VIPVILLILFGLACLFLIVDGLKRRGGIFEFSFLAGCGLFGFLFPQAVGIVRSPGMAPEAGVCKALIMSTLCALAVYFGWKAPVRPRRAASPRSSFPLNPMYLCGVACIIVGTVGFVKLAGLTGGVTQFYSVHGSYTLKYQGLPVAYYFFELYSYLGLVLVTLIALRLRFWLLLAPAAIPLAMELANVVFLGRRTELVWLTVVSGTLLYFARGLAPPRAAALALAPLAMAAMFVFPAYRAHSEIGGDWARARQDLSSDAVHQVLSGSTTEFWSMSYLMEIADTQNLYQYGVGFYNTFIGCHVPKLIVGQDFKQSLYVNLATARAVENRFGWVMPYGEDPTGPYSAFEQFWYFGAICFYLLARWLKKHWVRALAGDFWSQVVYSATTTYAVAAVVNDLFAIYLPVFMFILPLMALTRLLALLRQADRPYCYAAPLRSRPGTRPMSPEGRGASW
jgi:hypothetical protein